MAKYDENDMLEQAFARQRAFMDELVANDKLPTYPIDLSSKGGQRLIKEMVFNCIEELCEASYTLKNRGHRITDDRTVDLTHYREELGDAFAFFLEICIMSGMSPAELFDEYSRKNAVVLERLQKGY